MWITSFDLGVKNFAFIITEVRDNKVNIIKWENHDISGNTWTDVLQNVNEILYENQDFFSICNICLVEKQMTKLNMKATKLSYHVMSFFNIIWPYIKVKEYSANHKTHVYTHQRMNKKERKQYCVDKTFIDLINDKDYKNLGLLLCHKKMDDMCDTYQMVKSYNDKFIHYIQEDSLCI